MTKFLITLAAIIGYGGWAFYSNSSPSMMQDQSVIMMVAYRAACIQGLYAGLLTLINLWLLEKIFASFPAERLTLKTRRIITVIAATIAQYSLIISVHVVNQTPNIFITLLPGFIIGTTFSTVYLYRATAKLSELNC